MAKKTGDMKAGAEWRMKRRFLCTIRKYKSLSLDSIRATNGLRSRKARRKPGFLYLSSLLALGLIGILTGCAQQTMSDTAAEKEKPVVVQTVKEETLPVKLSYTGLTSSGETKKYSFKMAGKISTVNVHKGDPVHAGQTLATLSQSELNLALEASNLTLQKAQRAVEDAQDTYNRLQQLYAAGAVAKSDLDKAKLDLDVKEASLNQAKVDVQAKEQTLDDTQLKADMDGYVVDVLFKEGEVAGAGYPVVVVRSGEQRVTIGLSPDDVKKVQVGTDAEVKMGDATAGGQVSRIDQVPDTQSRTYNTEILLTKPFPAESFYLGSTVKVELAVGGEKGIWVPITSILNDGEDYVYLVQDGRAVKRNLKLLNVQGFNVKVEGLKPGEQIVTVGMKDLKEGVKVKVEPAEKGEQTDNGDKMGNGTATGAGTPSVTGAMSVGKRVPLTSDAPATGNKARANQATLVNKGIMGESV